MTRKTRQEAEKLARRLNGYFHALFGAWLGMTVVFWVQAWGPLRSAEPDQFPFAVLPWLGMSIVAGLACRFLPGAWFEVRDADRTIAFYEGLGIVHLRRWITDGDYVRQRVRSIDPTYIVDGTRSGLQKRLKATVGNERAHLGFLLYGLVAAIAATLAQWWPWAIAVSLGNIAVNLLPVLLQRYTRARVTRLMHGSASTSLP